MWSCVERVEEEQKLGAGNNPRKVLSFKSVDSTAKINALRHQGSESRDHCKRSSSRKEAMEIPCESNFYERSKLQINDYVISC